MPLRLDVVRTPRVGVHTPFAVRYRAVITCVLTLVIWSSGALRFVPRDGGRHPFGPEGALARVADAFTHAGLVAYAVGAVVIWAVAHRVAALRARTPITREIF